MLVIGESMVSYPLWKVVVKDEKVVKNLISDTQLSNSLRIDLVDQFFAF